MTERPGPEDVPPSDPAGRGSQDDRRAVPADANAAPAAPLPRDAGSWAAKIDRLPVASGDSPGRNVAGRRLTGPVQGFGKMWRKTYWINVSANISPQTVITEWKKHFGEFWPAGNRFKGPLTGLGPGDVALLDVSVGGGVRLSTGVFVLYADEESFTLMTPEGHMFAGWITFSAERAGGASALGASPGASTVIQTQVLMRANDPLYELAMSLGGHRKEDQFWVQTMTALARYLGALPATVHTRTVCIDRRRQWGNFGSIWHNSMVRSMLHSTTAVTQRRQREK
ncbi:MAG: hypothetical protein ABR922_20510 [Streptosporangiaceae bacterium]